MEELINSRYNKETKVIEAVFPRAFLDSTLVHKDKLSIVYDVYSPIVQDGAELKAPVNLLFLHGSGMNRCVWEYYVAHLLDRELNWSVKKIVLMDQVTHGDSGVLNADKLGVNFDWTDGARDACKVAECEFSDGSFGYNILIGHSMGGFQALGCGILMPSLFQLILPIEPVALMYNYKNSDVTILPKNFYRALYSRMDDTFQSAKDYESFMRNRSFFTKVHPDILKRIIDFERRDMPNGTIKTKMERRQNIICYLTLYPTAIWLLNSLKFIKAPVVSIVGGLSKWSPKENQETLERLIPSYRRVIISEGDHLLNIEMPDETLNKLSYYISRFVACNASSPTAATKNMTIEQRRNKFATDFEKFREERVRDGPVALSKF